MSLVVFVLAYSGQVFSNFGGQRSKVKVTGDKKGATSATVVSLA